MTAENASELKGKLAKIRERISTEKPMSVLVRAFLIEWQIEKVEEFSDVLIKELPMAEIVGCGSNGSIVNSKVMEGKHLFIVTFFDKTKLETLTYEFGEGEEDLTSSDICNKISQREGACAVELFTTLLKFDARKFLGGIHLDESISIFGSNVMGVVPNGTDDLKESAFILSRNGVVKCGAVVVIYISDDLHVKLDRVLGWKPIGMELEVTKSTTRVVQEINRRPAYEIYQQFLEIPNDENFVANTIGFPFFTREYGYDVLRIPADCTKEGYVISNAGIPQGRKLKLAYGNPGEIIIDIRDCRERIREFKPEAVLIYDCILRKAFWGKDGINIELGTFENFPKTAGFFSEGELFGVKEGIIHNECTFMVIAMREGSGTEIAEIKEESVVESKEVSMLKRMATFVERTTSSLNSAYQQLSMLNRQLQTVNVQLSYMALTDELTQLFNRREIEQRIHNAFVNAKERGSTVALIMIDIDFFKKVNDTYGHATGDMVLKEVAQIIHNQVNEDNDEAAGRWGGEEFIIMLPGYDTTAASKVAEKLRHDVESHNFEGVGQRTVSIGVASANDGESEEEVFIRSDNALYKAKQTGRNRVVVM